MKLQGRDLRLNLQGDDVAELQQNLRLAGWKVDAAEETLKLFGDTTRQAVMDLQRQHGLQPTGVVDVATAGRVSVTIPAGGTPGGVPTRGRHRVVDATGVVAPKPGEVGAVVEVSEDELTGLMRSAFAQGEDPRAAFVWQDLDSELAVLVGGIRVALREGLLLVGIPVRCDQTAADGAQLVVPVALGTPDEPAGMVGTVETPARGADAVVARWGETAVAATWLAFLDVCGGLAAHAGEDDECRPLLPGAVWATQGRLGVVPQARYAIDRAALP